MWIVLIIKYVVGGTDTRVNDLTTATLMQTFYQKMLQQGQNSVAAMRAAQLEMWKSGKAPYYWAAFTIQGEWQ
jgi:CHAT domain-containing protein